MKIKTRISVLNLLAPALLTLLMYVGFYQTGNNQSAPLTGLASARAQPGDPSPTILLTLTDSQNEYPLGYHLEILEDPSGELSFEQVSSPEYGSKFILSQAAVPNYGFTDSIYWVRFNLDNQTSQVDKWLLESGFANMHFIDLYTPTEDGRGFTLKQTGVLRPAETRDVRYPRLIFELGLPPYQQQTYYLRFQSGASMTIALTVWTQAAFLAHSLQDQILYGIFFGILIGLLFYNLFLLYSLREISYFYYVLLLAAMIFEEASYAGYLGIYAIPNLFYLSSYTQVLAFSLLVGSVILFTDTFLELRKRLPKYHQAHLVLLAGWGLVILLMPFVAYHILATAAAPLAIVSLGVVFAAGISSRRHGFLPARLFILAWFGFILTTILILLVRLGLTSSNQFTENSFLLGEIWLAVCWSLALADRINLLKADTEIANRNLESSERRLSKILDSLPLGVVVYGNDQKPRYVNRKAVDLMSDPARGVQPDISANRTLAQALRFFSLKRAGDGKDYPVDGFPVFKAFQGVQATADDIVIEKEGEPVTLEILASPINDETGNIEYAVASLQDITQRKQAENELFEHREHLEALVVERTAELSAANEQLQLRVEWLSEINLANQIMAGTSNFTQIYEKILEIINRLFSVQNSFIAEFGTASAQFRILAHSCQSELHQTLVDSIISLPEGFLSDLNDGQYASTEITAEQFNSTFKLSTEYKTHFRLCEVNNLIFTPLKLRDQQFGVLGLEVQVKRIFTEEEFALLGIFSVDIAQLIEDSHLIERSKEVITSEERNRLARELHDSVTQVLFSITLVAEVLPQIWRRDPERAFQSLEKLRRLARGALAEMRTLLIELRPAAVTNARLGDLLSQLTEAVTSRIGLPFRLIIEEIPSLPGDVQINFYRIAQEALNNVVKHAQARAVLVGLNTQPQFSAPENGSRNQRIILVIQDDGVGFSPEHKGSTHLGLSIMNERASAINATLSIVSQPGYGTRVTCSWSPGMGQPE